MSSESFSDRLSTIWRQGGQDLAVSFLRRAISLDNTLAEVIAALQFDGVRDHLGNVRLKDILAPQGPARAAAAPGATAPTVLPARQKRTRRSTDEMHQLKARLLGLLQDESPGSLDTVQLMGVLQKDGHRVDTILVNGLLRSLEDEGDVTSLGGKPKAWRVVQRVQQAVAQPATIVKAHSAPASSQSASGVAADGADATQGTPTASASSDSA